MNAKTHIITGIIFTAIVYTIFQPTIFQTILLFLSTWFFIDLDHVIRYFYKQGNLNPKKFFKKHSNSKHAWLSLTKKQKRKYKYPYFIFHNVETFLIIFLAAQFFPNLYFVLIGTLFHIIQDYIAEIRANNSILFKFSLIGILIYNKNKIKFEKGF